MEVIKVTQKSEIKKYITLLYAELFGENSVPPEHVFDTLSTQLIDTKISHDAFCLRENDATLAFFTLGESFSIFAHGKYGIINELWVNPSFRQKGIGKTVIQEILKIGEQRKWNRIDVTAPPDEKWDRTFNFYQENGFTFTGRKLKIYLSS